MNFTVLTTLVSRYLGIEPSLSGHLAIPYLIVDWAFLV